MTWVPSERRRVVWGSEEGEEESRVLRFGGREEEEGNSEEAELKLGSRGEGGDTRE